VIRVRRAARSISQFLTVWSPRRSADLVAEADCSLLDPLQHDRQAAAAHHPFQTVVAVLPLERPLATSAARSGIANARTAATQAATLGRSFARRSQAVRRLLEPYFTHARLGGRFTAFQLCAKDDFWPAVMA
jgi:hypothetical protein